MRTNTRKTNFKRPIIYHLPDLYHDMLMDEFARERNMNTTGDGIIMTKEQSRNIDKKVRNFGKIIDKLKKYE